MLALAAIGKTCSILFFFGAWWCYIPPKHLDSQHDLALTMDQQHVAVLNNGNTNHTVASNSSTDNDRY